MPEAPSTSALFHTLTCAGWTSNLLAISAVVSSSLSASRATLALNAGLCFLRLCFMVCSSWSASVILGAAPDLSHLSSFWGPPHFAVRDRGSPGRLQQLGGDAQP